MLQVEHLQLENEMARETAALLTATAFGPVSDFAFCAPSHCGLGVFAREALVPNHDVGECALSHSLMTAT